MGGGLSFFDVAKLLANKTNIIYKDKFNYDIRIKLKCG